MSGDGQLLPSARSVSLAIHKDSDRPHAHLMALTAVWGEFISHDVVHTPQTAGYDGTPIKCCGVTFENFHPDCFPIRIADNDPYYGKTKEICQEYVRSSVAPRIGCTLGPREQINQASSFLDASQIYGTTRKRVEELRLFQGGLLRTQAGAGGELLPSDGSSMYCKSTAGNLRCFKAGDDRVNEHIGLAALHTMWLREHNRIARELSSVNPHWSDEVLFQEARRVVIAEIQHITYNEYLPVVLGQSIVADYGLKPKSSGFYTGYDINTNVGVLNAVGSAALWFFASLMPKTMPLYDLNWRKLGEKSISESFYSPFDLYRNGALDQLLRGLLRGKAQSEDQFINDVMTNRMFETDPFRGLDLAAQLLQQGRDHGLPGYIHYRELCGLGEVKDYFDLNATMAADVIDSLRTLYSKVQDIDLFSGALAEYPQEGAVVGPTFGCLLGIQFQKLKNGDRFWYENDLPPSAFTLEQLQEMRKVTLGRIICDNSNAVDEVQPSVFLDRDPFLNSPMHCEGDAIRRIDFEKWYADQTEKNIPSSKILDAIKKARSDISRLRSREMDLWKDHKNADPHSPVGTAFGFNKPKPQALEIANTSFLLQFATVRFLNGIVGHSDDLQDSEHSHPVTRDVREVLSTLPSIEISALTELPKNEKCGEHDLPCDHTSIFRGVSGWCNNLKEPNRGKAFTTFKRLLPSEYADGLQTPKSLSTLGTELPSARLVSFEVHDDISVPHQRYSLLLMQFAQLLDHDLTHTPMNRGFGGSILDCHSCDAKDSVHPECWPITVPDGDPYFPNYNKTTGLPFCLHFVRSLPGQLTLGVREQLNQVTAYVDASHTYGSDTCEAKKLRTFVSGRLNTTKHPAGKQFKDLLPQTPDHPECKAKSGLCFEAGDLRSSEQPALAAIHTMWLREHNRLVDELHKRNPHWDDELLYQHARRILSAVTQHITYGEFLPRILGWDSVHKYGLELVPEDYFHGYDPKCDATIFNEFATAAFRFGHSLLKPAFKRFASDLRVKEPSVQLRHTFFDPDLLFRVGMVDELLYGLANTPMETLDNFITEEVTNHLFEEKKAPLSGMDLAALNIQRARDHGIPGYNNYRELCNLTRARAFDDLKREIPPRLIQKLKKIYATVDDIDLFPGGLAETPLKGGVVGPTFGCIIGKQFQLLRKCDRFWYENAEPLTRFTSAQLTSLRKSTLAKLICHNSDSVQLIQRAALDLPEPFLNPRVPCDTLPEVELDLWRDRLECNMNGKNITLGSAVRVSPCVMCLCSKEGPLCQSMKVDNCIRLSRSFKSSEILKDHVCKVQCAFAFRIFPPSSSVETLNSI
ncbi:Peroxidasin [Orchesella cincta]|uniref:Peroxidasin n=1 Tax=Orchesella cincta TaxID=48709 RepID=A0A1D2NGG8_ORCCI|nr:Peroxidasin [Orchesella cincta]